MLAVPVAPPGSEARLTGEFDEVVCLEEPHGFFGVGQFYVDFGQVEDDEVVDLLTAAHPSATATAADPPTEEEAHELRCEHELAIVPGATHLFEEPGALERVSELASHWFLAHLRVSGLAPRP